jgi:hypothetical protein
MIKYKYVATITMEGFVPEQRVTDDSITPEKLTREMMLNWAEDIEWAIRRETVNCCVDVDPQTAEAWEEK